jgi:acetylornithine deacetylase/succinyl-diaminopimelate desuccinylase-like protein
VEMDRVTYTSYMGKSFTRDDFHPAWNMGKDSDLVNRCINSLEKAGIHTSSYAVPYCTNASFSAGEAAIPAVVFGPGDIAQAHASNEYLEVSELEKALVGYQALAKVLSNLP